MTLYEDVMSPKIKVAKGTTYHIYRDYTEDGVIFDENSIQVMPMESSINTGKWDDVKFDNPNDSPYN